MSEHIEETTDQLAMRLEEDPNVTDYVALKTVSYPACPADGSQVNLLVEIGDHSVFPVSYAKGSYPKEQDEIALSSLLAQELGVKIGDSLAVDIDGSRQLLTICGLVLKSFGADGFRFVFCPQEVLFILLILAAAAAAAVWFGIGEVKKIKAYECCMGKE